MSTTFASIPTRCMEPAKTGRIFVTALAYFSLAACENWLWGWQFSWFLADALFIWAVIVGRVLETSLGYFMTPILNVLLGAVVLRERLSPWQLASILIASAGVLFLTFGYGRFPWVAVALCLTFGIYGLLRK